MPGASTNKEIIKMRTTTRPAQVFRAIFNKPLKKNLLWQLKCWIYFWRLPTIIKTLQLGFYASDSLNKNQNCFEEMPDPRIDLVEGAKFRMKKWGFNDIKN